VPEPADLYPWVRRERERGQAYAAFQEYLRQGPRRTVVAAAEAAGISADSAYDLSKRHDWVARATAYDQHLASAATDGLASQMASARDDNLSFAGEMRDLAFVVLRNYAERGELPPAHFAQFILAFVRVEEHSFRLKEDPKTSAALEKARELLARFDRATRT
jgi:hypothetical protein